MTYSRSLLPVICILLAGVVLAQTETSEKGTPDRELGLSKASVFDIASPEPVVDNDSAPGERPLIDRVNSVAPPTVPHGIVDFLPVTLESNMCIDCHQIEEKQAGEPTPIPSSHYTDLRREPEKVGESVVGARYNCIACHVSLTEASALVENRFAIPQGRP
jgi:cytochrome c-type protein NapB